MLAALSLALVGCDLDLMFDDDVRSVDLRGLWTGVAEITDAADIPSGINDGRGVVLPVALELGRHRFTLRSTIPTNAFNPASRLCRGVYSVGRRTLTFFPDTECRALPLWEYTTSRRGRSILELRARSGGANVQVWMRLEREVGP